jgi:hypothetical protein
VKDPIFGKEINKLIGDFIEIGLKPFEIIKLANYLKIHEEQWNKRR